MGKELVKSTKIGGTHYCVKEMRAQENVSRGILLRSRWKSTKGTFVFKDLLTTSTKTQIADIYIKK
jgi:magnesium transporter